MSTSVPMVQYGGSGAKGSLHLWREIRQGVNGGISFRLTFDSEEHIDELHERHTSVSIDLMGAAGEFNILLVVNSSFRIDEGGQLGPDINAL